MVIEWLLSNAGTLVVLLILAGIVAGIVISMIRNKKKGKSSCGCPCEDCVMHDRCKKP